MCPFDTLGVHAQWCNEFTPVISLLELIYTALVRELSVYFFSIKHVGYT
jgi:hypothetical protein